MNMMDWAFLIVRILLMAGILFLVYKKRYQNAAILSLLLAITFVLQK